MEFIFRALGKILALEEIHFLWGGVEGLHENLPQMSILLRAANSIELNFIAHKFRRAKMRLSCRFHQQGIELALTIEGVQIIAAANVAIVNENLGNAAPSV